MIHWGHTCMFHTLSLEVVYLLLGLYIGLPEQAMGWLPHRLEIGSRRCMYTY